MYCSELKTGKGKDVFIDNDSDLTDMSMLEKQLTEGCSLMDFPGIYSLPRHDYMLVSVSDSGLFQDRQEAELTAVKDREETELHSFLIAEDGDDLGILAELNRAVEFIYEKYLKNLPECKLPFKKYKISHIKIKNYRDKGKLDRFRGAADISMKVGMVAKESYEKSNLPPSDIMKQLKALSEGNQERLDKWIEDYKRHNPLKQSFDGHYSSYGECWVKEVVPRANDPRSLSLIMKSLTEYRAFLRRNTSNDSELSETDRSNIMKAQHAISSLMQMRARFPYIGPTMMEMDLDSVEFETEGINSDTLGGIAIDNLYEKVFGSPELVSELLRRGDEIEKDGIKFEDFEMRAVIIKNPY